MKSEYRGAQQQRGRQRIEAVARKPFCQSAKYTYKDAVRVPIADKCKRRQQETYDSHYLAAARGFSGTFRRRRAGVI
jgi:hypothetical protein